MVESSSNSPLSAKRPGRHHSFPSPSRHRRAPRHVPRGHRSDPAPSRRIEAEEAGEGEPRMGLLEGVREGSVCPWCAQGHRRVRGWRTFRVRDIPNRRRRTVLVWRRRRRFECGGCGRTHIETLPQVTGKFTLPSRRLGTSDGKVWTGEGRRGPFRVSRKRGFWRRRSGRYRWKVVLIRRTPAMAAFQAAPLRPSPALHHPAPSVPLIQRTGRRSWSSWACRRSSGRPLLLTRCLSVR